MEHYYININALPTGVHEIHIKECKYLPTERTYLGNFEKCDEAVQMAKTKYDNTNGCPACMPQCHKKLVK